MKNFNAIDDFIDDNSFRNWVLRNDPYSALSWKKWLLENPEKSEILNEAKTVLLELDISGNDWSAEKERILYQKIQQRINKKSSSQNPSSRNLYTKTIFQYGAKAAVIAFLLVVSVLGYLQFKNSKEKDIDNKAMIDEGVKWISKSNPKGQKSKIHLPDGSTVILNAESQIKFNADFGKSDRDLFLEGESFFEVAKDSLVPFRVFTGDLVTIAMGTSFNINSYDKERVNVQLATGQVKVFKEKIESDSLILHPGEEIFMEKSGHIRKRNYDKESAFLWKDGTLKFMESSFSAFRITLERWYGVEIGVKGTPPSKMNISGEYKDKYLSNVLESLGYAYDFDYEITQKKVTIKFK